jgi:hypothetical protein
VARLQEVSDAEQTLGEMVFSGGGPMDVSDIRKELMSFLKWQGWSAKRLSRESGLPKDRVAWILRRDRVRVRLDEYAALRRTMVARGYPPVLGKQEDIPTQPDTSIPFQLRYRLIEVLADYASRLPQNAPAAICAADLLRMQHELLGVGKFAPGQVGSLPTPSYEVSPVSSG